MGLHEPKGLINAARTGAAPGNAVDAHPEWTLMYRKGLSRKEIAELARVEFSAVAYHAPRKLCRQGELSPARSEALDAALPGWLEGRKGTAERPPSHNLL